MKGEDTRNRHAGTRMR
ncbi:hypothetical protein E2C01_081486 [Portunus trituberculatus]|uniref:Uncharacterized protein n=1 Tax=Portunus trituberculatus TaxID=210409 RepID=A0A5B7IME1_PORTR|nr:hypothetical protein [Portunus trituberculatus]